jgi:hypothetical protein
LLWARCAPCRAGSGVRARHDFGCAGVLAAGEKRRARQRSERERRKDRKPGGLPGHPGKGLARDPDPGEREDAAPPAECRKCGAGLDGAAAAGQRWAQSWDVRIVRVVTEWLLPGLACPCCKEVTFAAPPPGLHAGSVSYGPGLNATAVPLHFKLSKLSEIRSEQHGLPWAENSTIARILTSKVVDIRLLPS